MENPTVNLTYTDLELASAYYPILINCAKNKQFITYGDLVAKAKELHPHCKYVQNALPVSTGRRLNIVRMFTNERSLPDITSLVFTKSKGECGNGIRKNFDPELLQKEVLSFDWSKVSSDFGNYIELAEKNQLLKTSKKHNNPLTLVKAA